MANCMALYEIIAVDKDTTDDGVADGQCGDSERQKQTLVGHIFSKESDGKYVYVIQFDDTLDANQSMHNCLIRAITHTTDETLSKRLNDLDVNHFLQLFNESNESTDQQIQHMTNGETITDGKQLSHEPQEDALNLDDNCMTRAEESQDMDTNEDCICMSDETSEVDCKSCSSSLSTEPDLPFICLWPQCDHRFSTNQSLAIHMRRHTGERPFLCQWPHCGLSFAQKITLKHHTRKHIKENVCDFGAKRKRNTNHMQSHRKMIKTDVSIQMAEQLVDQMKEAALEDIELNKCGMPSTRKLKLLPSVVPQLLRREWREVFIEAGVLDVISEWLSPLPDGSLPFYEIRNHLFIILQKFDLHDTELIRSSRIDQMVRHLSEHPMENKKNKRLALELMNCSWFPSPLDSDINDNPLICDKI